MPPGYILLSSIMYIYHQNKTAIKCYIYIPAGNTAIMCYVYITPGYMLLSSILYTYQQITYCYHVLCVHTTWLHTSIKCYVFSL